ncbi:PfkB family carbohydrate kinase [Shewanella sp. A32]|uniref:PfkB family carbohydrate kinase n=1 Tax=Shewanella sp. A32 TaxID=3031327 RepID=UPI0023B955E0|nr:PfkB family carbohydrate kinase [Shewanella sp. A32]MDF0533400.1 PfkB family carbohydrate kinase [Shewanella sp. A32]
MANILLVANLNCDRLLLLNKALRTGGRFHYQDGGRRLGGGGANTGIGLEWAGHKVALVSQLGRDELGDWVLAEAGMQGLDCRRVQRHEGSTSEILLVMTPDGERTIIRPERPRFQLAAPPRWSEWDALYLNTSAEGAVSWALTALPQTLVVAQLAKDDRSRPCHVLLSSHSDMHERTTLPPWEFAQQIAGEALRYFIVTEGEQGARLYRVDGELQVPAVMANVVDTTGAGDVYAAGLIHGLLSGLAIEQAMQEAAIWGAYAVASETSVPGVALQQYLQGAI